MDKHTKFLLCPGKFMGLTGDIAVSFNSDINANDGRRGKKQKAKE